MDRDKVKASREAALKKIMTLLDAEDIEGQFAHLSGDMHSAEKFLVTWNGMWRGMHSEFGLHKVDEFYRTFSRYCCIYASVGLFHQHQFAGYHSFERGLIEVGLKLCPNPKERSVFYAKYTPLYNERLKAKKDGSV